MGINFAMIAEEVTARMEHARITPEEVASLISYDPYLEAGEEDDFIIVGFPN